MEGAMPAQRVCRECRVEKPLDQFFAVRGSRIVTKCLDCRGHQRESDIASATRISAASAIPRGPVAPPTLPNPVHLAPRQNLTHRVLAGMYHQGGRVETDAPEMAAARGQIAAIQRQHRVQRRHGEQPSQTPTMSGLFRQEQPADVGDGLPPSAQPRQSPAEDDDDNSQASQPQLPRPGPVPSRRPRSSSSQSRGRPRGRPRLGRMPVGRPSTRGRRAAVSAPPRRDFDEPGPRFSGDDQEAPLSSEDIAIKREFDEALAAEDMKRFQAHSARLDDKGRG
ncbi:uncharacterized protein B0H64DRAFT_479440, partial [Chaetomium fimeti]